MALVGPKTYYGYDSNNECVAQCTAPDATTLINPEEVKKAVEDIITAFTESLEEVTNQLRGLTKDTDEALIVKGTKMTETVEQTADAISQIPAQVESSIGELYDNAVEAHRILQEKANEQAREAVSSASGVVRVSE